LARLEARSSGRWYVVKVGANWQGDVAAELGLAPGEGDLLVIINEFEDRDAPPRLAGQPSSSSATGQSGRAEAAPHLTISVA
jgi:hypothetical protein